MLLLAGWILAVLGWGVATYLFFSLSQMQDYAVERRRRADDLMATIPSSKTVAPTPTTWAFRTVEGVLPTQTMTLPAVTPVQTVIPLLGSRVPSEPITSPTSPSLHSPIITRECHRFVTISEGLELYLESSEASQIVLKVPVNRILTNLGADDQWFLLRDEDGTGGSPVEGWAKLRSLEKFTECLGE
jgi:hypothetical protein